ncbi:MAG: hypothetical protein KDC76_06540 [Bacteroidetes bacterium]|nr:hypothetical protein [Bacteroidota bacterium]
MELGLIILFLAVGLIFLLVEILITPGLVLGIVGIVFMTFGILRTYTVYGSETGNIVLLSVFLGTILLIFLALKGGIWKRMASKDVIASKAVDNAGEFVKIGDEGQTISALRPSGNAIFSGRRIEVSTMGDPIPSGVKIAVLRIAQNKVYVRVAEDQPQTDNIK